MPTSESPQDVFAPFDSQRDKRSRPSVHKFPFLEFSPSSLRRAHETDGLPAGTKRLHDPARVKRVVLGDNDYVYDATRFFRNFD